MLGVEERMRTLVLALLAVFVTIGCDPANGDSVLGRRIGRNCSIHLRPDALGTSANIPVSVMTDVMNGAQVSVTGKLLEANEEWIVIQDEPRNAEIGIPRSAVLAVRFFEKP